MAGERLNEPTPAFAGDVSATLSAGDLASPPVRAPREEREPGESHEPRGRLVGRYVILSLLGQGGMGAVYAAYDPELDRKVALKLLRPDAAYIDSARMMREARALAKLAHPNVVGVHDVGTVGAEVFIAMEFVDGLTVTRWLRQRPRSLREVLDVFLAAGRGLAAAHQANLVHRDFKPDNMMVAVDGRVRVLDFGLARTEQSESAASTLEETLLSGSQMATGTGGGTGGGAGSGSGGSSGGRSATDQRLTREGTLLGTPSYMAPEQWRGAVAEARSDQFSFCVALWEALYGERPFRGSTMHALMTAVTRGKIEAVSDRKVPAGIRRALERGLSQDPVRRFETMDALLAALEVGQVKQRRRVVLAGLAVIGLGAGGVQLLEHQRARACEAGGAAIEQVWNSETREALRAGLLATGVDHAESSAQKAAERIDAWAATWSATRTAVCNEAEVEGTRSPELYAQATECLDEQRETLAVLLEVFTHASATDVQRLVPAVAGLAPIEPCSERRHLERRPRLPELPEARAQVLALRHDLRRATGLGAAGRYDEARALAETSLASAEALGYSPMAIEARLEYGALAGVDGVEALRRVYVEAGEIGADENAATAAVRLISLIGVDGGRPAEGLQWALPAQVLIKQLGQERGPLAATLHNNKAMVLRSQGHHDEALALYQQALEIREQTLGPTHPGVAAILNNLGNLHRDRGDREAALAAHQRALEIREQALGPDHPDVSATLNNLGLLEQARGNYGEAQAHLERALKIAEGSFGPESLGTASMVNNLGRVHQLRGNYDEAEALLRRALVTRERELGPRHLDVAISLQSLGMLQLARGERLAARESLERVLHIRERQMEESHPEVVQILDSLGTLNYRIGDLKQAQELHERALEIQRARLGEDHVDVAHSLRNLAQVHNARGDREQALTLATRALAIGEAALGPDHPDIAAFLNTLGLLQRGRDRTTAAANLERALQISLRTRGPRHPATATSLQRLGDLHTDAGEYAQAEQRLGEALAIREAVGREAPEVADVLVSLGQLAIARERPDEAIPLLERAVQIRSRGGVPGNHLAQARFELARALRAATTDRGGDKARARELATEALAGLRSGAAPAAELETVESWLRG